MKRTLILYASTHHGNTRRLAEAMAEAAGAELCDLLHDPLPDLSGYDLIGMASGIYYGKLHPRIPELLRQLEPRPGQRVFLAYTCGIRYRAYEKPVLELLRQKLELEPESEETLWEVFESAVAQVRIGKGGEISLHQKDQKECAL